MSLREPLRVGSTPDEAPEVIWNVLVEVDLDQRLTAADLDAIQARLWERLSDALHESMGPHVPMVSLVIIPVNGRGEDTPLFPIVAARQQFTCNLDVEQAVERMCANTALANLAYDVRGRAYELGVHIDYRRRPAHDGESAARLPSAAHETQAARWGAKQPSCAHG